MRLPGFSFIAMIVLIMSGTVLIPAQDKSRGRKKSSNAAKTDKTQSNANTEVTDDLQGLLKLLDDLGRGQVKDAKAVQLNFSYPDQQDRKQTTQAWLLTEDDKSVAVLQDDILP